MRVHFIFHVCLCGKHWAEKKKGAPFFENGCALFEKRMHPFQKEVGVIICDRAGINVWKLITLANKHSRVNSPLDYLPPFVYMMQHSYLILTDSGEVQDMETGRHARES
jgi:hypothetical protein